MPLSNLSAVRFGAIEARYGAVSKGVSLYATGYAARNAHGDAPYEANGIYQNGHRIATVDPTAFRELITAINNGNEPVEAARQKIATVLGLVHQALKGRSQDGIRVFRDHQAKVSHSALVPISPADLFMGPGYVSARTVLLSGEPVSHVGQANAQRTLAFFTNDLQPLK